MAECKILRKEPACAEGNCASNQDFKSNLALSQNAATVLFISHISNTQDWVE
jgi:hypothetical protein